MKPYKVMAAGLLAASVLMPSVAFAAPWSLHISHRDITDSTDQVFDLTPPVIQNDSPYIPFFIANPAETDGTMKFFGIGSGIGTMSDQLYVTPATIETPEGHLSDTLSGFSSSISTLNGQVGALGSIPSLVSDISANLYGTSTSMTVLAASTTSGLVPKSTWNALQTQVNALASTSPNWTATSTQTGYIQNKPTLSPSYEGTTLRANSFPIFKSATVGSGVAVVNFTSDGTAGGTALCTGGVVQDSVNVTFNDSGSSFQQSWAWSNSNKTLTVTANRFTTANILSGILGQAAANGSVAKVSVWCYA